MKKYYFKGQEFNKNVSYGDFYIIEYDDGSFYVYGNVAAVKSVFRKIHRMPPNKYGNFFGREKAGHEACRELINNGVEYFDLIKK